MGLMGVESLPRWLAQKLLGLINDSPELLLPWSRTRAFLDHQTGTPGGWRERAGLFPAAAQGPGPELGAPRGVWGPRGGRS